MIFRLSVPFNVPNNVLPLKSVSYKFRPLESTTYYGTHHDIAFLLVSKIIQYTNTGTVRNALSVLSIRIVGPVLALARRYFPAGFSNQGPAGTRL